MLRILVTISILLTAACATTRRYQEKLQGWVGRPSTELIAEWGPPTSTSTLPDGSQLYLYRIVDEETLEKTGRNLAGYTPSCRTTFQVRQGVVAGWKWDGQNCRAK